MQIEFELIGPFKYLQKFYGKGQCRPPLCDEVDCKARSNHMWGDARKKSVCLCNRHAEEMHLEIPENIDDHR